MWKLNKKPPRCEIKSGVCTKNVWAVIRVRHNLSSKLCWACEPCSDALPPAQVNIVMLESQRQEFMAESRKELIK